MTEAEQIIRAAKQVAAESEAMGTTSIERLLNELYEIEIRQLCAEKEKFFTLLMEKVKKQAG